MIEELISRIIVVLPIFAIIFFIIFKLADIISNKIIKGDQEDE